MQVIQADAGLVGVVAQQQETGSGGAGHQGEPQRSAEDAEQARSYRPQPCLSSCDSSGGGCLPLSSLGQLDGHLRLHCSAARRSGFSGGQDGGGLRLALVGVAA